jgi:Fic family protein
VLNSLFLIQENLLTLPILYLSRFIIQHRKDYYRLLRRVTKSDSWEEWVTYMLSAVEETARWTTGKIQAIRNLQAHTAEYVRGALPKIYTRELIEVIFERPYCRIQNLTEKQIAKRETASRYLKELVRIEVLELKIAGRDKLFIHPKLMQLLTRDANEFANYR